MTRRIWRKKESRDENQGQADDAGVSENFLVDFRGEGFEKQNCNAQHKHINFEMERRYAAHFVAVK